MELIYQLAVYEKAPEEITVTLDHFEESGFGENPVWWAFVAEVDGRVVRICFVLYSLFNMEGPANVPRRYFSK